MKKKLASLFLIGCFSVFAKMPEVNDQSITGCDKQEVLRAWQIIRGNTAIATERLEVQTSLLINFATSAADKLLEYKRMGRDVVIHINTYSDYKRVQNQAESNLRRYKQENETIHRSNETFEQILLDCMLETESDI